jgi:hypothetical protein
LVYWKIPGYEFTGRIAGTSIKMPAFLGNPLPYFTITSFSGTAYTNSQWTDILAFSAVLAGQVPFPSAAMTY